MSQTESYDARLMITQGRGSCSPDYRTAPLQNSASLLMKIEKKKSIYILKVTNRPRQGRAGRDTEADSVKELELQVLQSQGSPLNALGVIYQNIELFTMFMFRH